MLELRIHGRRDLIHLVLRVVVVREFEFNVDILGVVHHYMKILTLVVRPSLIILRVFRG